jgi:hypothetical protein
LLANVVVFSLLGMLGVMAGALPMPGPASPW